MRWPWNRVDSEIEREIAHHLHELAAEFGRQGHSREEAIRLARREFGGQEQVKEQCRDESPWSWWIGARQDVLFGLRMMRKTPVITAAAVLSLALGIGANSAIGSLMDVVLWRNLPVPEPQQLTFVNWQGHGFPRDLADGAAGSMFDGIADFFSYSAFQSMRRSGEGRAELAAFTFPDPVSVSHNGNSTVAQERPVSGNFLAALRVKPVLGRLLRDDDDREAAPATVVLAHRFWLRTLQGDPGVIGQTMRINDKPHLIAGVLEPGFFGLDPRDPTELYTPLHHSAWLKERQPLKNDRFWCVSLIARRAPGVTAEQLKAQWEPVFRSTWKGTAKDESKAPRLWPEPGNRGLGRLSGEFKSPLLVLGALVGLLLIMACTNIANLLLARATARQKEVAMRVSLGCSQARLMRQFLTESAMLAICGGAAAVGVAYGTANMLGAYLGTGENIPVTVALDHRLMLTIGAITAVTLLLFGVFPAWRASRVGTAEVLKRTSGSAGVASRHWWNTGRLLVLGQMAMSIVLVMTAVVFVRNLRGIEANDPGFDRRNLVMFGIRPGVSGYAKTSLLPFYFALEQRLAATPGVAQAGLASVRPMNVGGWWQSIRIENREAVGTAAINSVTPNYLPLLGSRLIAGRGITPADIASQAKVAVITEDLARKLGDGPVLGRRIYFDDKDSPPMEVIGVVPSIASNSIKERPFAVWVPLEPGHVEVTVAVRTSGPAQAVLPGIRKTMETTDPNLPLVDVVTMEEQISKSLQRERMFATLCGGLGVLALVLAVVGLYGVMSYSTTRRRSEIGVRLALGAVPRNVVVTILKEGLTVAATGIAAGTIAVWLAARYVEKELFRMKPLDPVSLALGLGILLLAAVLAIALPALRAAKIQPLESLRQE